MLYCIFNQINAALMSRKHFLVLLNYWSVWPVKRLMHVSLSHSDNPMSDIYGANLYNRYLKAMHRTRAQAQGGSSSQVARRPAVWSVLTMLKVQDGWWWEARSIHRLPEGCSSILVCTGVYNHDHRDLPSDPEQTVSEQQIFHGHRDFCFDPSLTQPSFIVHDVLDGVELVFQQEGWSLQ